MQTVSATTRRLASLAFLLTAVTFTMPALTGVAEARRGRKGSQRVRQEFRLIPTAAGRALALRGKARTEVRPDRRREKVNVEVESWRMQPGSVVEVWFVNPANSTDLVFLAEITLRQNPLRPGEVRGEVEINTGDGDTLPAGASPVQRITEFRVLDADTNDVLLQTAPGRSRNGDRKGGDDDGTDDRGRGRDDDGSDDRGRGRGRHDSGDDDGGRRRRGGR